MYEGVTRAYLSDPEVRKFLEEKNPWALKGMAERLLEAIQRGMWRNPRGDEAALGTTHPGYRRAPRGSQ